MKHLKFCTIILYTLLCALVSFFILSKLFVTCFIAQHILKHFDFQIVLYIIISIILVFTIFTVLFFKNLPLRQKIITVISCFIVFIIFSCLPEIKKINDIKICYKTGICAQGLDAETKDNITFKINKENCEKYNYKWNKFKHTCDLRSERLNKTK